MNASKIFEQLMQQAGGKSGAGGVDVKGMLDGLSKQFGGGSSVGGQSPGGRQQGSQQAGGGFDMKSLLGGGALGLLVGSRRGRRLGGKALKYGAIAGVGVLAWKAWQNYQGQPGQPGDPARDGEPVEQLAGQESDRRSLELLQALIMAARADGHVDEREQALVTEQIDALGADRELHEWV
jgi:uncharacterized membrane protein YebE (DUF533 family)